MQQRSSSETLTTSAIVSFFSHIVVYAFLLFSVPNYTSSWRYLHALLTFGTCAFLLAPLLGIVADLTENPHRIAQCGVMLQLCGILFPYHWKADFLGTPETVFIKMVFLGLGFGIFHTFAGANILRRDCGNASHIGIFLAPGALGLAAVLIMPLLGYYCLPLLALTAAMPDNCKAYGLSLPRAKEPHIPAISLGVGALLLLSLAFIAACIPSLDTLSMWDRRAVLLLALAMAGGRAAGGFLRDLLGPIAYLLLPLGGILITADGKWHLIGVALLSAALPMIFRTVASLMPSAPGLAYGLCSAPLFVVAWLVTRESGLDITLPSPLLSSLIGLLALGLGALWIRHEGTLLTHLRTRLRASKPAQTQDTTAKEGESQ